jgi:hypothetical protein
MLKEFLLQLSKDLNVEPFAPNDDGSYLLSFEPNVQISLRENANSGITLHTKIGVAPLKDQEDFYLKLMKANLLGKETGEAHLGLDKESKEVTMTAFLAEGLKNKELKDRLEDFVNYAESWQKEVLAFVEQQG